MSREINRDIATAPILTTEEAGALIGGLELFKRCVLAGWIKPAYKTGTIRGKWMYKSQAVYSLIAKLEEEQSPPPLPRKPKQPCNQ